MRQFQVPQFITVEDRIIGPLTLKQFLYLLGAGGTLLIGSRFVFLVFVPVFVPLAGFFVALAFLKVQDRPFPAIVMAAFNYYLKPRLYIWRKLPPKIPSSPSQKTPPPAALELPGISESKLSDLAWSLDVKEKTDAPHG